MSSRKNWKIVSLFSGCGGMDLGFHGGFECLGTQYSRLPFEVIWANDLNEAACRTYRENLAGPINQGDIWTLMDNLPKSADVVIGGFPCQDISVNGKMAGVSGRRSGLYRAMVEVVAKTKPKIFVAENVKGLLMSHSRESLATVLEDFRSLGYQVSYHLYHAANYGVPQTRERVMIVGTKRGYSFSVPAPTHSREAWVTAEQAISDLEAVAEDHQTSHTWSRANRSPHQGDRRLIAGRPGYTIRAECHGNIQWHYKLDRRISMREAARFQAFPDGFKFAAKLRETERMIGNAVPPVLAWHVANSVLTALEKKR